MRLSAIIPTLNEEDVIEKTLARAQAAGVDEVIVVDGGSQDATCEKAKEMGCQIIRSARGRALQMNAGAKVASGHVLLFLHADTLLPKTAKADIEAALFSPHMVGGRFDIRLDRSGLFYMLLAGLINLRSSLTRIATGDQAIFVRREVFEQMGGFAEIPLMEDVEFTRRLKKRGQVACLRQKVITSARRWEKNGRLKTVLLMWLLRLLYFFGVSPNYLKRLYADAR